MRVNGAKCVQQLALLHILLLKDDDCLLWHYYSLKMWFQIRVIVANADLYFATGMWLVDHYLLSLLSQD